MARQLISKAEVPSFIFYETEFRWGSLTGYNSAQGDYIIKSEGDILAVIHYTEEGEYDHWYLDTDSLLWRLDHVALVKRGKELHERGYLVKEAN